MANLYRLRCPTRQAFERGAKASLFNTMAESPDTVLIRRGAVVGRFVGGGQSKHSTLSVSALGHVSPDELDNAVMDLSKAFPTMGVANVS
jgi:hypothetical protein